MRRRWKLLVAVGAVALFAVLLFLLPPRDDGLDWIRKYGGTEQQVVGKTPYLTVLDPNFRVLTTEFIFDRIPEGVIDEVRNRALHLSGGGRSSRIVANLTRGGVIVVERDSKRVIVFHVVPLNWFERQWLAVKTRVIGMPLKDAARGG